MDDEPWEGARWGVPKPRADRWVGDALTDLHEGRGTTWRRDAQGSLYPDCACHGPKKAIAHAESKAPAPAPKPDAAPSEEPSDDAPLRALLAELLRLLKVTR